MKKIQFLLLSLALFLLIHGLYSGQLASVYQKASLICLECIGLG